MGRRKPKLVLLSNQKKDGIESRVIIYKDQFWGNQQFHLKNAKTPYNPKVTLITINKSPWTNVVFK